MASAQELALASEMNFRQAGKEDTAKLIHEAALTSPTRPSKIRKALQTPKFQKRNHTPEEALSLYIETNSSKGRYQLLRNSAANCKAPQFYPTYIAVKAEMDKCIPNDIVVTEDVADVRLQSLLDHTAKRIVLLQKEVIERHLETLIDGDKEIELVLEGKYGFDGSSGQSNYKQKFKGKGTSDDSIFISSYVPLKLSPTTNSNTCLWYNVKLSSSRYCRPIRMRFAKETTPLTLAEKKQLDDEISRLQPTIVQLGEVTVKITHSLSCTMIDGKVASVLTGVSTMRCTVCKAYPKEFHNVMRLKMRLKQVSNTIFDFGLSPLHFGIRAMECLLRIAYRVDFKCTRACTKRQKVLMRFRKLIIQEDFKISMGLRLDMPCQGSGSTNDGNTARRFFKDPALTSRLIGLNETVVTQFSIIYRTINSGFFIDVPKFRAYCEQAFATYLQQYSWFTMPPTIHKMLFHGADIIAHCQRKKIPISAYSEEAQETRNKDLKNFREERARKCDRVKTNEDVFRRLLMTSDAKISSLRRSAPPNRKTKVPAGVRALLSDAT